MKIYFFFTPCHNLLSTLPAFSKTFYLCLPQLNTATPSRGQFKINNMNCPKCEERYDELRGLCIEVKSNAFEEISKVLNITNEQLFKLKYAGKIIYVCFNCKTVFDDKLNETKILIK